ncbi:MAG TPA: hypothetical protein VH061_08525 [Solirubrobacteraceae bacterium]|jgi:hypothetical protein|nr:hypothetical protein [Solirubrobacteraceae bacterium]
MTRPIVTSRIGDPSSNPQVRHAYPQGVFPRASSTTNISSSTNSPEEATEMTSIKARTTILALVASLSFGASTVAPAVSQARPKSPTTKADPKEACDAVVDSMLNAEAEARRYEKAGDTKNAEASWTAANLYFDVWSEQGCATVAVTGPIVASPPATIPSRTVKPL